MLIVSPYARAGYTDSQPASSVSVLTFIEKTFGLQPLQPCGGVDSWDPQCTDDARDWNGGPTYDFSDAFDFNAPPAGPIHMVHVGVPPGERAWLRAHPHAGDQPT
jgi:phospholipase C